MTTLTGRFTIKWLMIAIAVIAGVLGLSRVYGLPFLLIVVFNLSLSYPVWSAARRHPRIAGWGVVASSVVACSSTMLICVSRLDLGGYTIGFVLISLLVPLVLGFGITWATEVSQSASSSRGSTLRAWSTVLILAVLPPSMILTLWPLRLAFLISRPAMNRLADRIAAGENLRGPEWAGAYRIVAARRAMVGGNIALLVDDDPSGASGFVRFRSPASLAGTGPMYNLNVDEALGANWRYQNED